jgi:hypothetical protein
MSDRAVSNNLSGCVFGNYVVGVMVNEDIWAWNIGGLACNTSGCTRKRIRKESPMDCLEIHKKVY